MGGFLFLIEFFTVDELLVDNMSNDLPARKRCSGPPSKKIKTKWTLDVEFPAKLVESLTNMPVEEFFENYWEKKPLHILAEHVCLQSTFFSSFTKTDLKDVLLNHKLKFGRDGCISRYVDGKGENFGTVGAPFTWKIIESFMNDKECTVQFHQPQRFIDSLWSVLEMFESYFTSLTGSNIYITPPNSQGLAPHHDDVEVFILQLEGKKNWLLYPPVKSPLPLHSTPNLERSTIGQPSHTLVMSPGDVLYFPRGTVHEANTVFLESDGRPEHSTHVTISLYQNQTVGDLLSNLLPRLVEATMRYSLDLRRGVPVGLFHRPCNAAEGIRNCVRDLKVPTYAHLFARGMIEDFMAHRLPPYISLSKSACLEEQPTVASFIRYQYPDHVCHALDILSHEEAEGLEQEEEEGTEDAGDSIDEPMVFLFYSTSNKRDTHMFSGPEEEVDEDKATSLAPLLMFPLKSLGVVEQLHAVSRKEGAFIPINELMRCRAGDFYPDLDSLEALTETEIMQVVRSLWASNLIKVK